MDNSKKELEELLILYNSLQETKYKKVETDYVEDIKQKEEDSQYANIYKKIDAYLEKINK